MSVSNGLHEHAVGPGPGAPHRTCNPTSEGSIAGACLPGSVHSTYHQPPQFTSTSEQSRIELNLGPRTPDSGHGETPKRSRSGGPHLGLLPHLYLDRRAQFTYVTTVPIIYPPPTLAYMGNSHRLMNGILDYPPHSHPGLTTHVILAGSLTIAYPDEGKGKDTEKETYGVGDRIDVAAGKVHEVWIGGEGCTYVIGE